MLPSLEDVKTVATLLENAPLAGFLALTLVALFVLFVLLMREKAAHLATVREVVSLTSAVSETWKDHAKALEINAETLREVVEAVKDAKR